MDVDDDGSGQSKGKGKAQQEEVDLPTCAADFLLFPPHISVYSVHCQTCQLKHPHLCCLSDIIAT